MTHFVGSVAHDLNRDRTERHLAVRIAKHDCCVQRHHSLPRFESSAAYSQLVDLEVTAIDPGEHANGKNCDQEHGSGTTDAEP